MGVGDDRHVIGSARRLTLLASTGPHPMKCPECFSLLNTDVAACNRCGCRLGPVCNFCKSISGPLSKFCSECGRSLTPASKFASASAQPCHSRVAALNPPHPPLWESPAIDSEQKPVSVLFSDLCGYSSLCERLDPEDVREMMNRVFKVVADIILHYQGTIHRIIGDEVLALFGIPHVHEDDPVRAIRSALDIHHAVTAMSEQFKERLEGPLAMHSGISTGWVVAGKIDPVGNRYGIVGDAVNRASLLTRMAQSDEILVGACTMPSTSGIFQFENRSDQRGRGHADKIDAYRVVTIEKIPDTIHRVKGLHSRMVGREAEMKTLRQALAAVSRGRGACVLIEGDFGTGKSRLITEFKNALKAADVQWLQGVAYAYTQAVPYSPLIDLLGRAMDVRAGDSPAMVHRKLSEQLSPLNDEKETIADMLGRLSEPSRGWVADVPPKRWKVSLRRGLIQLCVNRSRKGVTVLCIEDLQWADPSTVDILRLAINETDLPVLILLSYRSGSVVVNHQQITNPYYRRRCLLLEDLSAENCELMVKSLLRTEQLPRQLLTFIGEHQGGNPFLLEEVINALIGSKTLKQNDGAWQIEGTLDRRAFSTRVFAVIAAKLDRLGDAAKCIVQEASVIGRRFSPVVLKRTTSEPEIVDGSIAILKSLGLIVDDSQPEEKYYLFKHALIQEVIYNSLMKQQRLSLHEKIARVMEHHYADRIDTIYATLAYHFSRGHSLPKAVRYLIRAGRMGLRKETVLEAHNRFNEAYQILTNRLPHSEGTAGRIVRLLLEWFSAFNLRGRYRDALALLRRHESDARDDGDLCLKGMYFACLGWVYERRGHLTISRRYLLHALSIGQRIENHRVIAYACAGLTWTCTDMGRFEEALSFAEQAETASHRLETKAPSWAFTMDPNMERFILTGKAVVHWFKGDCRQCRELGHRLLAHGENAGDVNSISAGHLVHGMGCFASGDYRRAIRKFLQAVDRSANPPSAANARFMLAYTHLSLGEIQQADRLFRQIVPFCSVSGYEYIGTSAKALASVVAMAKGSMTSGVKAIVTHADGYLADGKVYYHHAMRYLLGCIYLRMASHEDNMTIGLAVKNLSFFLTRLPLAAKLAENQFNAVIRGADRIDAIGLKALALRDMGRLYRLRKRNGRCVSLIKESMTLFEQVGADRHLRQARALLDEII
jgi:class 3 adenylate cyclase/tetratricopeptide (TPR) repeat protein